jgi:hypothetical protein
MTPVHTPNPDTFRALAERRARTQAFAKMIAKATGLPLDAFVVDREETARARAATQEPQP